MSDLQAYRREKDAAFRADPYSPIPPGERARFTGLAYYPERPDLRFVLPLERAEGDERVTMQTSTGDEVEYHLLGRIRFEVAGRPARLAVYASDEGDLFLPFRDATSGQETYGGGRYLEPEWAGPDQLLVDFNLAYNPYCAYSDEWSCPLPPAENWLDLPIEAGEKKYHG